MTTVDILVKYYGGVDKAQDIVKEVEDKIPQLFGDKAGIWSVSFSADK